MNLRNLAALFVLLAITSTASFAQSSSLTAEELKDLQNECEMEAKDYDLKGEERDEFIASCISDLSPTPESEDSEEDIIDADPELETEADE